MADYTWYVDPAATGSNNGTDWTNAYTSLNACEAAKNSLTGTDTMTVNCRSSGAHPADSTQVTWDGSTTTGTITIQVAQSDRAVGKYETSKYRLQGDFGWTFALVVSDSNVDVIGIQAKNDATGAAGTGCFSATVVGPIRFIGCIGAKQTNTGVQVGLFNTSDDLNPGITYINCLAVGGAGSGFVCRSTYNRWYNCVAIGNGQHGFEGEGYRASTLVNCYSGGNTGDDYNDAEANVVFSFTNCASEDGTGGTTIAYSAAGTTGTQFTNITAGSEDVHIASASQLKDAGTNPSAGFTTDIDGDTISTWMIGCDYYVSSDEGLMGFRKSLRMVGPRKHPITVLQ